MRRVVVVALLVVISTIFVIPGVTLPKTTLQAQQMADQVFWLLATAVPELLACFTVPQQISLPQRFSLILRDLGESIRPTWPFFVS